MPGLTLASIHIYPLKGARAVDLDLALVQPCGLAGDRRWLLVDEAGRFISQREEPAMARVVAQYTDTDGAISVFAEGHGEMSFAAPAPDTGADMFDVTVWSSTVLAAAAGRDADKWFSAFLDRPVRLAYLDDPTRRSVNPEYGAPGDVVSFADGFPLLLTSTGSLDQLGDWLAENGDRPVPMNRFRPNVVVTGAPAWAEDQWRRVKIGDVCFRVAKPCGRCVVTTTDQHTGERGSQPLKMLGRRRRFGTKLVFGQNIIPDGSGTIRAGDPVQILESSS
jgi:hypothetical protein